MNATQRIVGTLVGGVTLFVLGYIIWEVLFTDFFAANAGTATGVMRETPVMWAVALGSLGYAALITLGIASRTGTASIVDGLITGAVVGLLMWGSVDLIFYGFGNLWNLTATIVDVLLETSRAAVAGAVIVAARRFGG